MESPQTLPTQQPTLGEEGIEHHGIEMITGNDVAVRDSILLEAFMNETVTVRINPERGVAQTVPVTLTVNSVHQHVFRGLNQDIKRKYLEVLARSVTTDLEQDEQEMMMGQLPRSITTPAHAFTVIRDTPKGMAWLADIQNQMH